MTLTRRQQCFVEEYVVTRCGAEAARRAGYSAKTACEMAYENLRKPQIVTALAAKEAELAAKLEIDRDTVVAGVFGGIAEARAQGNAGVVIRGWCEVAKMLGLYEPETVYVAVSAEGEISRSKFEGMSDAELLAMVEGRLGAA